MPKVTAVAMTTSYVITLTGTGFSFLSADFLPVVIFANVSADVVTIVSDTSITAQFNLGIPVTTSTALKPVLLFN